MAKKQAGVIKDPENYAKLNVPFANADAAANAVEGFMQEFYELRNKWKFANAMLIAECPIEGDKGEPLTMTYHAGDQDRALAMSGRAFGNYLKGMNERAVQAVIRNAIVPLLNDSDEA